MELSDNSKHEVLTMQEVWENSRNPLDKEMSRKLIITLQDTYLLKECRLSRPRKLKLIFSCCISTDTVRLVKKLDYVYYLIASVTRLSTR